MKLVSVSALALAATAQANINKIIEDAMAQIYQETADGFTVSLEPYFTMEMHQSEDSYASSGTYGNGGETVNTWNEEFKWSESTFEATQVNTGRFDNIPGYQFLYPESLHNSIFDVTQHMEVSAEELSLSGTYAGHVDNKNFDSHGRLAVEEFSAGKKLAAKIRFSGEMNQDAGFNEYCAKWMMPAGKHNVLLSAKADSSCGENPLQNSCSANVKLTGQFKSADIGKNKVSYSVKNNNVALLKATRNKVDVFQLKLTGFGSMDFIQLSYKCAKSQPRWKLVIKVPGPATFPAIEAAAMEFAAPYVAFFGSINSLDAFAHVLAYADVPMAAVQDMGVFDCSELVAATGVESAVLADIAGWSSVQEQAQAACKSADDFAVHYLAVGAPYVTSARAYVKDVVSAAGEAKAQKFYDDIARNL